MMIAPAERQDRLDPELRRLRAQSGLGAPPRLLKTIDMLRRLRDRVAHQWEILEPSERELLSEVALGGGNEKDNLVADVSKAIRLSVDRRLYPVAMKELSSLAEEVFSLIAAKTGATVWNAALADPVRRQAAELGRREIDAGEWVEFPA